MSRLNLPELPIHTVLPKLLAALDANSAAVLTAEPGSGKTTIAPLVLLDQPWLAGQKIIILEPRRLAARAAAARMSQLVGDAVGGTIGYLVRFDTKVSRTTKIEVVTEGILIRMLQNDPELAGIGLIIFDEFHERSLQGDLALALCLDGRQLRDDLKVLIMSATIDSGEIAALLGGAPVVSGQGRCFPVAVEYLQRQSRDYLIPRVIKGIERGLAEQQGDMLVFLPGAGEIRAVQKQYDTRSDLVCLPLYGDLPLEKQNLVFARSPGKRRLILATPIAETSLTIEGISIVVDSGQLKSPRFDPSSGLTRLQTIPISKASADQRTGRAGRLGPGHCYRLWTSAEHHSRPDFLPPEIINADLAPFMLELALWGVSDPGQLTWLNPPRRGQILQARTLLINLGAIDDTFAITPLGRQLAGFPLHPRLGMMMLVHGRRQGLSTLACRLAATLNNRDPLKRQTGHQSVDIEDRLQLLAIFERDGDAAVRAKGGDPDTCRNILREAGQYQRLLGKTVEDVMQLSEAGNLLASAYPDRIAHKKQGSGQYLLASGRGAVVPTGDHFGQVLVAAQLDAGKKQGRIFLAAALSMAELRNDHGHLIRTEKTVRWDAEQKRVSAVEEEWLGSLLLSQKRWSGADPEQLSQCLLDGIRQFGSACLPWQKKSRELQARIQTAHIWQPDSWPDLADERLLEDLSWLQPYLTGAKGINDLKKLDLFDILLARLSWQKRQELERVAPIHIEVASGSRIKLHYQPGETPILAVRIQQMFGCAETPTVAGGKLPVLIHLLSPAHRPIQITSDLATFWRTTYGEVKKELAGRYPKHYWPENPLEAQATNRAKKRKR